MQLDYDPQSLTGSRPQQTFQAAGVEVEEFHNTLLLYITLTSSETP